ncbi:MAG TPA: CNP1-like family protein [Noviherbaspirillum sp.]|nr:CNP1-like family protein [Noviherbaspirillum sp.]
MLLSGAVLAQTTEEDDAQEQPWKEVAIELPASPRQEDLLSFYVSATATQSFAVDARSLSVGSDGVIRYTLIATSEAGAKNVSYEGIRCATFEKKLYAFGQADGTWTRSRRDEWQRISDNAANRQHAALAKDFFCLEKTVAGSAADMVSRLRHKRPLTPQ